MISLDNVHRKCPDDMDISLVQQRAFSATGECGLPVTSIAILTAPDTWKGHPAQTRTTILGYSLVRLEELLEEYAARRQAIINEENGRPDYPERRAKLNAWMLDAVGSERHQERLEVFTTTTRTALQSN